MKRIDVFYWLGELRYRYGTAVCKAKCQRVGAKTRFGRSIVILGGKAGGGRGITIGSGCTFNDFCQLITEHYDQQCGISIGDDCHFNFVCYLSCFGGLEIGNHCLLAPGVKVITGGHNFDDLTVPIIQQGTNRGRVVIEDNVWIGTGAIILPGVSIGSGSVVAAGAVVARSVARDSVVAGVPAAVIRMRGQRAKAAISKAQHLPP